LSDGSAALGLLVLILDQTRRANTNRQRESLIAPCSVSISRFAMSMQIPRPQQRMYFSPACADKPANIRACFSMTPRRQRAGNGLTLAVYDLGAGLD